MSVATKVEYAQAADVFWCVSAKRQMPKGSLRFRKFPSLDAAVRFFVTDTSEKRFQCTVDTDLAHYEGNEIDDLFGRPDFPEVDMQTSPICSAGYPI